MYHAVLQLIPFLAFHTLVDARLTDIVNTTHGPVRGQILTTIQKKIPYSSFTAIPYGKPPVGYLRFKPPEEAENWTQTFDALGPSKGCPQLNTVYLGDEDCLYLNVYSPKTKFNSSELPVIVWIYGGYFLIGAANSSLYGPDFLIEENIVIVFVNYRLGALGFLSLNHPNATGNAALKDQVLALKWVQKNIKNFGGDPTQVTIMGESAGAASVELLAISDMTEGLYSRSIAMSGTPLSSWGFCSTAEAVRQGKALGVLLNFTAITTDELLRDLYSVSAYDIVIATHRLGDFIHPHPTREYRNIPFRPTMEDPKISKEPFIVECPEKRYENGQFHDLPHLLGFLDAEMAGIFPKSFVDLPSELGNSTETYFDNSIEYAREMLDRLHIPLPNFFEHYDQAIQNTAAPIVSKMNEYNNVTWKGIVEEAVNITTDLIFIMGIDQTQRYRSRSSAPVYYYRNTFGNDGLIHHVRGIDLPGVGHGDDCGEVFWMPTYKQPLDPSNPLTKQRKKLVKMWSNFAKFGNPTPKGTHDRLLNVTWVPSGEAGLCLEMGKEFTMSARPIDNLVKLAQMSGYPIERLHNGCFKW